MALGDSGQDVLFAEVKWSTKKVGIDIYQQLKDKSQSVAENYRRRQYALFSRSGFTAAMKKLAREEKVLLIHGETRV